MLRNNIQIDWRMGDVHIPGLPLLFTPDERLFISEIVRLVRCLSPYSQGSE